jgi:hypothetical protein
LNDIDFITDSFDCIPESLADDFLFRHVHPFDPPGRTLLQLIDAESALRVDVFRAYGDAMERASKLALPSGTIQLLSIEDLAARMARLTLDLANEVPTPLKHAADFLRLVALVDASDVETAWLDHRKPEHPASFKEVSRLLQHLITARQNLLITPTYSKNVEEVCLRCRSTSAFRLADPKVILTLLGYV